MSRLITIVLHSRWFIVWSVVFRMAWPDPVNVHASTLLLTPATYSQVLTTPQLSTAATAPTEVHFKKEERLRLRPA